MKRKIVLLTVCALLIATLAKANWLDDFISEFQKSGIDEAVKVALNQGAVPDEIMDNGLKFKELNPQNLVKAMYCGGIRGDDIRAAGQKYDVSDLIIIAGYKRALRSAAISSLTPRPIRRLLR